MIFYFILQWWFLLSLIIHQYKGVNCNDIDDHTFKADVIIMAIPAGPSASVEFKPKLSLQKTHALRTTPYSSSTKVRVYQDLNFLLEIQNKVHEKLSIFLQTTVKD